MTPVDNLHYVLQANYVHQHRQLTRRRAASSISTNFNGNTRLTFVLILITLFTTCFSQIQLNDVTVAVGLPVTNRLNHFGGASVADLNGDGFPDLMLGGHTLSTLVYFNNRDGTFSRATFYLEVDAHGINAFHIDPSFKTMSFMVSRGGRKATQPNAPLMYSVSRSNQITEVKDANYEDGSRGRGRSALFVNLQSNKRRPDVLFLNAKFDEYTSFPQKAARILNNNKFETITNFPQLSPEFSSRNNHHATVTDINNDMQMEVLSYQNLRVYQKGVSDFELNDITGSVLPRRLTDIRAVRSIAELDYNNDGLMDLYISRSTNNDLKYLNNRVPRLQDILLKNIGGSRYIEVTFRTKIPAMSSQGVTVGDFDNDGLIDLFVTRFDQPDLFLRNTRTPRGTHSFQAIYDFGYYRNLSDYGDQPMAVDYDRDGRIDIISAEGDWFFPAHRGFYKVLKNNSPYNNNAYLLVRVKSSPQKRSSSLHALVTVCTNEFTCMIRRVGTPGAAVSDSYIELVHFGLGQGLSFVQNVTVRWVDGQIRTKTNLRINSLVGFGS